MVRALIARRLYFNLSGKLLDQLRCFGLRLLVQVGETTVAFFEYCLWF